MLCTNARAIPKKKTDLFVKGPVASSNHSFLVVVFVPTVNCLTYVDVVVRGRLGVPESFVVAVAAVSNSAAP